MAIPVTEMSQQTLEKARHRLLNEYVLNPETGCWLAQRSRLASGYATMMVDYIYMCVHRWAWWVFRGPIPEGCIVRHTCGVRHCYNPDHLQLAEPNPRMRKMYERVRTNPPRRAAKLTWDQVRAIRSRQDATPKDLAEEYGVSPSIIRMILANRVWVEREAA